MCCCRYKCICLDSVEYVRDCTNHCPPVHMCGRSVALCMRPISSAYVISISSDLCLCNSNKISNNNLLWLLTDLGRTISKISGEVRESCYLFQRCLVLVRRFNTILLHNSIRPRSTRTYDHTHHIIFL